MTLPQEGLTGFAKALQERLSGVFLSKAGEFAHDLFYFHLSKGGTLWLDLQNQDPHIFVGEEDPSLPSLSSPASAFFRKELANSFVLSISCSDKDRILYIELESVNAVFKKVRRRLILELIPRKANLILVDDSSSILFALRPASLTSERPLLRGMNYSEPQGNGYAPKKRSPFDLSAYQAACLEEEKTFPLRRKQERFKPAKTKLKTKKKAVLRKIEAIARDEEEAKKHLDDGQWGDWIYMHIDEIPPKAKTFSKDGVTVDLDPAKNASENAQSFYRRAKRAKAALSRSEENRRRAENELSELIALEQILEEADESILEDWERLYGWSPFYEGKKTALPSEASWPYEFSVDGVRYLYGRNARQNDFLSFAYATRPEYIWIHVKQGHGAHLIIQKANPSDKELLIGLEAVLAASGKEDGEVIYCPRKEIRRGKQEGEAILHHYQSAMIRSISDKTKDALSKAKKIKLR